MLRTSSLLRLGLQHPLQDVVATQPPERIVVDGVHAGAEGLPPQLCHPTGHQPTGRTQQQQQQQLQHGPGPAVSPGRWLAGPRARLGLCRDRGTADRKFHQSEETCILPSDTHLPARTRSPLFRNEDSQAPKRNFQEHLSSHTLLTWRLRQKSSPSGSPGTLLGTRTHSGCLMQLAVPGVTLGVRGRAFQGALSMGSVLPIWGNRPEICYCCSCPYSRRGGT